MSTDQVREEVRARYAEAANAVRRSADEPRGGALQVVDACCGTSSCCSGEDVAVEPSFGAALYDADEQGQVPAEALAASLG